MDEFLITVCAIIGLITIISSALAIVLQVILLIGEKIVNYKIEKDLKKIKETNKHSEVYDENC